MHTTSGIVAASALDSQSKKGALFEVAHRFREKTRLMKENVQFAQVERTMRHVDSMSEQLNKHVDANTSILERILRHQKRMEQQIELLMATQKKTEEK